MIHGLVDVRRIAAALVVSAGLVLAACSPEPPNDAPTPNPVQESAVKIEIAIGDQRFRATLDGSTTSRDLGDRLPVTLQMRDHGSVEKTGRLPAPLSVAGQPAGADAGVGDVGYYAPGNDLVLYYGDQSFHNGIVVLGRMEGDAAERIAGMEGTITATVSVLRD